MRKFVVILALVLVAAVGVHAGTALIYQNQNTDIDAAVEVLDSSAPDDCLIVTVQAAPANTGNIYVGSTTVATTTGYVLTVTQPTLTLNGDYRNRIDASALYVTATAANQTAGIVCIYE